METITKANELTYFLWSMACGAAMAVVYDFLRARRREKKLIGIFVYIEDILWLGVLGALVYILAFRENAGQIRWYSFLGIALGAFVYKLALGDKLMNLFRGAYALFVRGLCFAVKILLLPLRLVSRLVKRPVGVVVWHSREGAGEFRKIVRITARRLKNRLRF